MTDLISRADVALIESRPDAYPEEWNADCERGFGDAITEVLKLPSVQAEYKPVTAEDLAKTMSENTLYSFMAWHGEALKLMESQGFVICKKTM